MDKLKINIICIPTTISGIEMTDHVELECISSFSTILAAFSKIPYKTFERTPFAKPIAVFYDPLMWRLVEPETLYPTLFQILSYALEALASPNISPPSEMIAIDCAKLCIKYLSLSFPLAQDNMEIREDILYCSYLGGECFYREEMGLLSRLLNILLEKFGISTADACTALLPYLCWYHQNTFSMKAREEIGIYDLPNALLSLQKQVVSHITYHITSYHHIVSTNGIYVYCIDGRREIYIIFV